MKRNIFTLLFTLLFTQACIAQSADAFIDSRDAKRIKLLALKTL